MYKVNNQAQCKVWTDEAGHSVPVSHIKKTEKVNERVTVSIAKQAMKVSDQLKAFKAYCTKMVDEAFEAFKAEYKGTKEKFKGNITIFNFDRSVKIEMRVNDAIKFDDMTIMQAKAKLQEFLKDGIKSDEAVIKEMVLDAFNTARGKLDVKKIMNLKRYESRIKDKRYKEAMQLISDAIRRPDSATYYRVWIKNEQGQYDAVPLALADV